MGAQRLTFNKAAFAALFSCLLWSMANALPIDFTRAAAADPFLLLVREAPAASALEDLTIEATAGAKKLDFRIEVARTPHQKAYGLMFRRALPEMTGMLFPYEGEQEVSMWMRNTYIPLDMLFIKSDGVIHRIEANTEPFSERIISSGEPVAAVLEIAGGEARRLGIAAGDRVRHVHFKAK